MDNKQKIQLILSGLAVGFVNGFLGGGGGIIAVPLLALILSVTAKQSHATAIFVILPLSVASAVVYFLSGSVDFWVTLWATVGVMGGGIVGALMLNKLNNNVVALIFSIILVGAGVKMFF